MRCPHCLVAVHIEWEETETWPQSDHAKSNLGYELQHAHCPNCGRLIVYLVTGTTGVRETSDNAYLSVREEVRRDLIYPLVSKRPLAPEVPDPYAKDFSEAAAILHLSPNASAALSRRVLQAVLTDIYNLNQASLAQQITAFMALSNVPQYLLQAVDAVRNVGNFAAHPLKDTATGQVLDVEPGEAEWLLDVLESLFDFAFVQPRILEERRKLLNQKLARIGKPPMKGKP